MTLVRKLMVIAALLVIANALQWLGFPWRFDAWWQGGQVSSVSGAAWAVGLGLVLSPWADRTTRWVWLPVTGASCMAAYLIAVVTASAFTSPLASVIDPIAGFVLATWSLAGGIAFLSTALWPVKPFAVERIRYVRPDDAVARSHRPVLVGRHDGLEPAD